MLYTVLAILTLSAPPITSVEELPKLLAEEYDLLQSLDQLENNLESQARLLKESRKKRLEIIKRRDSAALKHKKARQTLNLERHLEHHQCFSFYNS